MLLVFRPYYMVVNNNNNLSAQGECGSFEEGNIK